VNHVAKQVRFYIQFSEKKVIFGGDSMFFLSGWFGKVWYYVGVGEISPLRAIDRDGKSDTLIGLHAASTAAGRRTRHGAGGILRLHEYGFGSEIGRCYFHPAW